MTVTIPGWRLVNLEDIPQLSANQRILFGRRRPDGSWHWWFALYMGEHWWKNTSGLQAKPFDGFGPLHWSYVPEWIENGEISACSIKKQQ